MPERKLAIIEVKPGAAMESQSGLQMKWPRIFGGYEEPDGPKRVAAIVMHPTSNFMGHYLISPLAARGIACMGLNSRYAGSDTTLLMERVIQDLGAGVKFLRDLGYERVVLIGNSGGAAVASFYQAQAENLTISDTPAGDPLELSPGDFPPVDGIVLAAAHAGRSRLFADWIDPSVIDERDPLAADPALDCYDTRNGPPFSEDFLAAFKAGQKARRERIEAWVWSRLRYLRASVSPSADEAFTVYRTHADPRLVDVSLDANDRAPGSIWGPARDVNYAANAMARFTTLTAFLSQWASCSRADGPTNLAKTSVPVLYVEYTADASTFPSTSKLWLDAAGTRGEALQLEGANHYLAGQPKLVQALADRIAGWCEAV
jgi:pimeloyl-ACP methyl ester carboxylesterase